MLRRHLRRIEVPDDAVDHVLVAAWTRRAVSVFSRLSGGRLLNEFRAGRSHALWRALTDAVGLG